MLISNHILRYDGVPEHQDLMWPGVVYIYISAWILTALTSIFQRARGNLYANYLAGQEETAISSSPIIVARMPALSLISARIRQRISKTEAFSRARSCRGIRRGKKILSSISRNARDPPALPFWGTAVPVTCTLKHIS